MMKIQHKNLLREVMRQAHGYAYEYNANMSEALSVAWCYVKSKRKQVKRPEPKVFIYEEWVERYNYKNS